MSTCLFKMPHDKCKSSDALQVYENEDGSLTGYCWSCGTYEPNPLGEDSTIKDIPKKPNRISDKEIQDQMEEVSQLKSMDLSKRKLREKYLDTYGIKIGYDKTDGKTPEYVFFPYTENGAIVKYKVKLLSNGKVWSFGKSNKVDLFGWEYAKSSGAKRLVITEGEFDCPALLSILDRHTKEDFKGLIPAICSLPNGASSAKRDISRLLPEIKKYFKDVTLCFDNDEPGQKAVKEVCKIFPEAKSIVLPSKDANDCILEGKQKAAFKACTFHSEKPKNSSLVWGRDVHEVAKKPAESGLSYPWEYLTKATRGIRFGETIYLGAGEKMGKSEILNVLVSHLIKEHKVKCLVAKPEEANNKTYKLINGKVMGKIFHDPYVKFDYESYDKGGEILKDYLCMLNLYQNVDWDSLKQDIYTAVNQGVKAVFIDPITNLTNTLSGSSEVNSFLQGVAQELATIAHDLGIVIFIFCHLNKPKGGGIPWDRGGVITTDYFAGSSAMARSCNYAFGIQGNKDPSLSEEERNLRELVILADREFGSSGSFQLYWNSKNTLFTEVN